MKTLKLSDYTITENGEVINNNSKRVLKAQKNGKGYLRVSISGRLEFVHRLVANQYVPNPENKPQVNHKDGNKLNNHYTNLEWVTNLENRRHACENGLQPYGENAPNAKLTWEDVEFVRTSNLETKELAKMFNISVSHTRSIIRGRFWKNS
jgi:hypothetical protein